MSSPSFYNRLLNQRMEGHPKNYLRWQVTKVSIQSGKKGILLLLFKVKVLSGLFNIVT